MQEPTKTYFASLMTGFEAGQSITEAEMLACRLYCTSLEEGYDDFVIAELYSNIPEGFQKALEKADVNSIVITMHSAFLMDVLIQLCEQGFQFDDRTFVKGNNGKRIKGLRMFV